MPDELYRLSDAYLDAAANLNSQIVHGSWESSIHRGQVVLFLAFHAVELCLKGCIKTLQPSANPGHHTLPKLAQQLNVLVPGLDYRVPFASQALPPDPKVRAMAEEHDRVANQQLRYPVDNEGSPWGGTFGYSAKLLEGTLEDIRCNLLRIREHIATRNGG